MEGKALVHEGSTYCVGCRPDAEALIGMNSGETKPLPSERAAPGAVIAAPPPPGQPLNPLLAAPPPQASPTGRVSQRLGKPPAVAELTPEQLMKSSAGDDEGAFPSTEQRPAAELRAGKAAPAATGPRCSRCKGPLEAGAAAGDVCPNCMLSSAADEESTRTALSLADVIGLKCAKCAKAIPQPDLARGDAGTVDGKLLCKQCRTKTAPRQASSKVNCQACDWAVSGKGYPYAGKTFCAACQPVFEQVLLEAVRPGPPAPCAQCKKPAVGDGILRVDGKVFCGACRKAAEFVVIYTVQSRRKPALKAAAQGSMGAPLAIAGGVVVFGLLVGLVAVKAIGKSTPIGPPVVDPLLKQAADPPYVVALTNARRLASVPAPSFQEAAKKLAEITALARDSGGTPEVQKAFKDLVDRATVERDVYARALVTIATNKANQAAKTSPEEALKALESVPKEVLDLPVAADLAKDRDRYQALIECRRRATALLSDPDPGNFAAMDTLAKSREAALCNFAVTEKGKELDIERRSRRTQVEAGAVRKTTLPPGNAADLVKKGGQQESKGDLAGAEATYEAALKLDPLGLSAGDALQGLARIDLEREHIDSARGRFRDLEHMAPDKPGTMVVQAWLQFLSAGHGDNRTLARASLKGLWKDGLGRLGRRLTAILDLGAPRREKTGYLLYAPTSFSEADLDVVERELEHTAKAVGVMLGVPPGDQRVPIVCFRDNASCAAFVSKLESTRDGYHIPGSFTVALVSPDAFSARAAVAQALGPRSIDPSSASSAWLAAALPLELASNDGVPGFGSMTLTQLEALSASAVLADPTALASARGIAAVIHEPGGVDVLKAYTEARRSHRSDLITKARRALDLLIKKARHD
jgi:tetratricopeptide (TPR) repeat protein